MRNSEQTTGTARDAANNFVREQFNKVWHADTREAALTEFGIALHTLQDPTSPAHSGFQEWTGEETRREKVDHVRKEVVNPGPGSELYKITQDAWDWFTVGQLPDGDLFTRGVDR